MAEVSNGAKAGSVAVASDNLAGKYSAAAKDKAKPREEREASMLFAMAEGHLTEEEDEMAMQVASEALELFRQQDNQHGIADASRILIHVLCYQDKRKEAAAIALKELERIQASLERHGEAKMLLALAEVDAEQRGPKHREEALANATQAQEMFHAQGDKRMEGNALLALVNIHLKRKGNARKGEEEALAIARKAQDLFVELSDKRGEAKALHCIAACHVKAKMASAEVEEGAWLAAARAAAQIYQESRLRKLEVWENCCIVQWTLLENPRKALRLAEEALALARGIGSVQEAAALGLVVSAHLAIKDTSKAWMMKEAIEAVKVAKDGVKRFRKKENKFGEGQALLALLLAYLAKEEPEQALKTAEQARGVFEVLNDRANEALVLQLTAQLHLKKEQPDKALHAAMKVQQLSKAFQDKFLALESIYEAHLTNRDVRSAIEVASQIQALAEESGERKKEGVARLLKCNAHLQQGDFVEAVVVAREAQAIFHDLDALQEQAEALRMVAEIHVASKDYDAGLRAAERARRILLEAADSEGEAAAAFLVAQIRLLMLVQGHAELPDAKVDPDFEQDCMEALEFAEEAAALAKKTGNSKLIASVLCVVAQIQTAAMEAEKAFAAVDEALSIFREAEDHVNMASVMCIEADVHLVAGSTNKALSVLNKALTIFREHRDTRGEWVALGMIEHITGPQEELVQEPQWTQAEWDQWQLEQWQAQQAAMGQQQPQEQLIQQAPAELPVVKKRAPRTDTGEKLDMNALSLENVERRLLEIVRMTVDADDDEEVEVDKPLMQMGITSKSAVALRNALSEEIPGMNLPFTLVFDYPTVGMMAESIMDQFT